MPRCIMQTMDIMRKQVNFRSGGSETEIKEPEFATIKYVSIN